MLLPSVQFHQTVGNGDILFDDDDNDYDDGGKQWFDELTPCSTLNYRLVTLCHLRSAGSVVDRRGGRVAGRCAGGVRQGGRRCRQVLLQAEGHRGQEGQLPLLQRR